MKKRETIYFIVILALSMLVCKRSNEQKMKIGELRDSISGQQMVIDSLSVERLELINENEMLRVDIVNILDSMDFQLWKEINR